MTLCWICRCFSDVFFVFLLLRSNIHFANLEILSFHSTVNEQIILQSILIVGYPYGWLVGLTRKAVFMYVHAKKTFLQKHREDSKAHICSSYSRLAVSWMKTTGVNESFLHCSKTQTWSCGMKIVAACAEFRDVNVCICMFLLYIYIVI